LIAICDIETNALVNPTRIWCIGLLDVATGREVVFENPDLDPTEFLEAAQDVSVWVGHNFIGYDHKVLEDLIPELVIPRESIIDTLVVSRLLNYNLTGGHSLGAWGERLGVPKLDFHDFSQLSEDMVTYLRGDLKVTLGLYKKFLRYLGSPQWKKPLRLEHDMAFMCRDMHDNGFAFDLPKARGLYEEIDGLIQGLDSDILKAFPPRLRPIREICPVLTKHGTLHRKDFKWKTDGDLTPFTAEAPFTLCEWEEFNPGSPKQIVERLNEAGWKPFEKTKGHIEAERTRDQEKLKHYRVWGWKVSEANLLTLPEDAPEAAQKLAKRILLASRRSVLNEWITAAGEAPKSTEDQAYIQGNFNHIGSWTQRMSHTAPNMANIPRSTALYGSDFRSLWMAPKDKYLVGVDADSIQLRILAHYMNDPRFTTALVSGDKALGTDAHTMNMRALGPVCSSRDVAKTFIYAWLLGAGIPKQAQILECSIPEAADANENFLAQYPSLRELKENQIPRDAARGYFEGVDGRFVMCDSEHLMLAGYLQEGESTVMKTATRIWRNHLTKEKIPFWLVNFVHDEWQVCTPRDKDLALYVANTMADSIRQAGEDLGLNCPLLGSIYGAHKQLAIGDNWLDTH
jgi:DNA polymerase I